MSNRLDLLTAVVSAVYAILNPEGQAVIVPVTAFEGDPEEFNLGELFPSVWVEYTGRVKEENEVCGAVFQKAVYYFSVYFSYDDHVAALSALEAVDDGLPGELPGTDRLIEADGGERLVGAVQGKYLYEQTYSVKWDD